MPSVSRSGLLHPHTTLPKLAPHLKRIATNLAQATTLTDPKVTLAPLLGSLPPFCTQWPGELKPLLWPSLGPAPAPKVLLPCLSSQILEPILPNHWALVPRP